MNYRVGVLVSGEGTNLQAILDTVHGRDGIEVVCVGSSREAAPGLQRADAAGVQTGVFALESHAGREERDAALGDWLEGHGVDLVVLAGFMEVLSGAFISRFKGRIVNVHPSLLPAFPGLRAIEQAVEHGAKVTGVTVHFVDEGVDSGPIILQEAMPLSYSRPIDAIEDAVHGIEHRLLPRAIRLMSQGKVAFDADNPRLVRIDDEGG